MDGTTEEKEKMTFDFKGIFRNKNHRQLKINNLERLESRRWVKPLNRSKAYNAFLTLVALSFKGTRRH